MSKKSVATTALTGCFGCHMSLLDVDERIIDLVNVVEFHRSPFTDIKTFEKDCDIGLIEGGCANSEEFEILLEFRKHCNILVAMGSCALRGGLPALRNGIPLEECLNTAYLDGPTYVEGDKTIPHHHDIPQIFDRVYNVQEIVKIDYFLPGCPPKADLIWKFLVAAVQGKEAELPYEVIRYD